MLDVDALLRKYTDGNKDLYHILCGHSEAVRDKALNIASSRGLDVDEDFVSEAAMLHDIGVGLCDAPAISCSAPSLTFATEWPVGCCLNQRGCLVMLLCAKDIRDLEYLWPRLRLRIFRCREETCFRCRWKRNWCAMPTSFIPKAETCVQKNRWIR